VKAVGSFAETQPRIVGRTANHFERKFVLALCVDLSDHCLPIVVFKYERGASELVFAVEGLSLVLPGIFPRKAIIGAQRRGTRLPIETG
jgi:hypothetical protein